MSSNPVPICSLPATAISRITPTRKCYFLLRRWGGGLRSPHISRRVRGRRHPARDRAARVRAERRTPRHSSPSTWPGGVRLWCRRLAPGGPSFVGGRGRDGGGGGQHGGAPAGGRGAECSPRSLVVEHTHTARLYIVEPKPQCRWRAGGGAASRWRCGSGRSAQSRDRRRRARDVAARGLTGGCVRLRSAISNKNRLSPAWAATTFGGWRRRHGRRHCPYYQKDVPLKDPKNFSSSASTFVRLGAGTLDKSSGRAVFGIDASCPTCAHHGGGDLVCAGVVWRPGQWSTPQGWRREGDAAASRR